MAEGEGFCLVNYLRVMEIHTIACEVESFHLNPYVLVVDWGFLRGRSTNPKGGDHRPIIFSRVPKNSVKMKKNYPVECPITLDPTNRYYLYMQAVLLFCFSFSINHANGWFIMNRNLLADQWFLVVMIYNGPAAGTRLHVNGEVTEMEETKGSRQRESSCHVVIGRRFVDDDKKYCSVMVDERMLWNRSLTLEETEGFIAMY